MLDLLQSKETAQYHRIGTNSGSTMNHQDLCEKDNTNQLANLANPWSTISNVSINNLLERLHCVVPQVNRKQIIRRRLSPSQNFIRDGYDPDLMIPV